MASIKCAHCQGRHDSVAEVRKCAGVKQQGFPETSGLSENQQVYLRDLLGQLHLKLDNNETPETISYEIGHLILRALIDVRRLKVMDKPYSFPPGVSVVPHPKRPKERTPTRRRNKT